MCGINGIVYLNDRFSGYPESYFREKIDGMNTTIAHRGPDGEGILIDYPVCLGHKRLSIIDLSNNAAQPMFNHDRSIAIVFNGEIYNYLELIPDLVKRGHTFKSKSDTEVIIHAYEEYGQGCVEKFNGMWSFVIYDFKKRILFASRDRFGVKPFYYYHDKDCLIFSSEINAILSVVNTTEANLGKVYDYLAYGYKTGNGETFFRNIFELQSAHSLIIENNKIAIVKYWDLTSTPGIYVENNLEELCEQFTRLLTDSIKLRFRSDVPVALLLSGGLDSTCIARVVDDLIEEGTLDCQEVTAYSAVFPGYIYDESTPIKEFIKTCKHIRSQEVTPNSMQLLESIDRVIYGFGEPVFNPTSFTHYALMKQISSTGVKVVINGQGSDESLCGYGRYLIGYFLLDILYSKPTDFLSQTQAIHKKMKHSYVFVLCQLLKAALPRRFTSHLRGKYQEKGVRCLNKDFIKSNYHYLQNSRSELLSDKNLDSYLKRGIQHYEFVQILHYEDHSSMQSSIEMRSPFVDYRMMEFAFSLPIKNKFDMGVTKKIIRDAFRERLPSSIINNNQKIGFATPFNNWLNDETFYSFVLDTINAQSFMSKKIWNANKIKTIFAAREKYVNFPYWRILNLELWSKAYGITNL
jgi:asparagine synthase (glutamine-hydrolysing)